MYQLGRSWHIYMWEVGIHLITGVPPCLQRRPPSDQGFPEVVGKGFAVSRSGETGNNGEAGVKSYFNGGHISKGFSGMISKLPPNGTSLPSEDFYQIPWGIRTIVF